MVRKMETVDADESRDSPQEIEESSSQPSISTGGNAPQELSAISRLVNISRVVLNETTSRMHLSTGPNC